MRHQTAASPRDRTVAVRLVRKYADMIDDVDISGADVGDELRLLHKDANLLIAEGWAEPDGKKTARRHSAHTRAVAVDKPTPRKRKPKPPR